jgi:hypothetical protein
MYARQHTVQPPVLEHVQQQSPGREHREQATRLLQPRPVPSFRQWVLQQQHEKLQQLKEQRNATAAEQYRHFQPQVYQQHHEYPPAVLQQKPFPSQPSNQEHHNQQNMHAMHFMHHAKLQQQVQYYLQRRKETPAGQQTAAPTAKKERRATALPPLSN